MNFSLGSNRFGKAPGNQIFTCSKLPTQRQSAHLARTSAPWVHSKVQPDSFHVAKKITQKTGFRPGPRVVSSIANHISRYGATPRKSTDFAAGHVDPTTQCKNAHTSTDNQVYGQTASNVLEHKTPPARPRDTNMTHHMGWNPTPECKRKLSISVEEGSLNRTIPNSSASFLKRSKTFSCVTPVLKEKYEHQMLRQSIGGNSDFANVLATPHEMQYKNKPLGRAPSSRALEYEPHHFHENYQNQMAKQSVGGRSSMNAVLATPQDRVGFVRTRGSQSRQNLASDAVPPNKTTPREMAQNCENSRLQTRVDQKLSSLSQRQNVGGRSEIQLGNERSLRTNNARSQQQHQVPRFGRPVGGEQTFHIS